MIDGVVRIKPLIAATVENKTPAVAISDNSNLFALVKFYKAASSAGIKPIVASDIWVAPEKENEEPTPLVLMDMQHGADGKVSGRFLCGTWTADQESIMHVLPQIVEKLPNS